MSGLSSVKEQDINLKNIVNDIYSLYSFAGQSVDYHYAEIVNILGCGEDILNNGELNKKGCLEEIIHNYLLLGKVDCAYLKNAENKALNDFLNSIGKMDVDGEINNLNYYENLIDEYCVATEENYLKYGVFSIKISIIIGALIVIFLI